MLSYEIRKYDFDSHQFDVRLSLPRSGDKQIRLTMPAWIPGSYMIRDFARHIVTISARDENGPVHLKKVDKQSWLIDSAESEIVVDYSVYAYEVSVRAAYLDRCRAYFNGTSLFLAVEAGDRRWRLRLPRPVGSMCKQWRVASTLPVLSVDEYGFGLYGGDDLSVLYDCPVEISEFTEVDFEVQVIPHAMAITAGRHFDAERLGRDLGAVCGEHAAMFRDIPIARYQFMTLATTDGYGGLEHMDSCSLVCRHGDLPRFGLDKPDDAYTQFLGLCSHEYFHLWNVKRIRPLCFVEPDLGKEVYTELLWAFEGITSYYDDLALMRSGVIDANAYLTLLARVVTRVMRNGGRHVQSVAESSFDAWTKFYKQDENATNSVVSYYAKGSLLALGLDVTLRQYSDDRISLDDLMRSLWTTYGANGRGVPERAIEKLAESLLGESLSSFFDAYVYGTDDLPLAEWFAAIGIGFRLRPAINSEDRGGYAAEAPAVAPNPSLGAVVESRPEGLVVVSVPAGSPAQQAGISAGDLLVALDGQRVTAGNLVDLLSRHTDAVQVHFFHRDILYSDQLPVCLPPADTCDLWMEDVAGLPIPVVERRNAWLRSNRRLVS